MNGMGDTTLPDAGRARREQMVDEAAARRENRQLQAEVRKASRSAACCTPCCSTLFRRSGSRSVSGAPEAWITVV